MSIWTRILNALGAFLAALGAAGASPTAVASVAAPVAQPETPPSSGITWGKVEAFVKAITAVNIKKIEGVLTAPSPTERIKDALVVGEDLAAILAAVGVIIPGAGEIEAAGEVFIWLMSHGTGGANPAVSAEEGGFPSAPRGGNRGPAT
jgi:hypothetical protein